MCGLLGIASNTQSTTDLEDENRRVKCQVIELFSDIFWFLIELIRGVFDALENVKADFNGVFAGKFLVILRILLKVSLST